MAVASKRGARRCWRVHVNSLWSAWYGILATAMQAYIATQAARRFLGFVSLPWPEAAPPPRAEVAAVGGLTAAAAAVLPFFFASALLKVGNLANDGHKLGHELAACSAEPVNLVSSAHCVSTLLSPHPLRTLWLHGGPTAPVLHAAAALLLLLPRLCMEARLISAGFLPRGESRSTPTGSIRTAARLPSPPPSNLNASFKRVLMLLWIFLVILFAL
ncbi:hypothetical protein ONE63_002879 [Megalurothrips usitatus]|uniref:Uncharacterized protein n=1 Tax=Megalurothrips usitatus TaxID=439358 RepID=A0AAV7XBL4_9NEOP|nr:hypothetical protein ONE63_002879 [Megalurothrips usitatus]